MSSLVDVPTQIKLLRNNHRFVDAMRVEAEDTLRTLLARCESDEIRGVEKFRQALRNATEETALVHLAGHLKQELIRLLIKYEMADKYVVGDRREYNGHDLPEVQIVLRPLAALVKPHSPRRKTY